jgi:hypothetical protein
MRHYILAMGRFTISARRFSIMLGYWTIPFPVNSPHRTFCIIRQRPFESAFLRFEKRPRDAQIHAGKAREIIQRIVRGRLRAAVGNFIGIKVRRPAHLRINERKAVIHWFYSDPAGHVRFLCRRKWTGHNKEDG